MIRSTFAKSFHRLLSHTTSPSPSPTPPPSHFSNPKEIPPTYSEEVFQPQPLTSQQAQAKAQQHQHDQSGSPPVISTGTTSTTDSKTTQKPHDGSIREITALIAMFALAYIAIDNYTERIRLDKLHTETTAINLKALQIQQVNYQREKQAREVKMLQERKEFRRRDFKMGLHVALLRKQLVDLGYEPVDIDAAIREFEKNVKQDNSIKHVNNQYLWLDDKSDLKPYLPDPVEYDKAKKKK
ncbi:hypothetical protein Cantr_02928 [Candida viswanathii]|uniref:Uncharacterized protein n=1 Tax=Candida viswanathii TaxID=5486 RepID=A0A367YN81_9ASCO|nr:hypothetical protein Cantr_02928 [Candida viswanathii]